MTTPGFALFDSALGRCAIAWSDRGIVGLHLPELSDDRARARVKRRFAGVCETPPPSEVRQSIDAIVALLAGQASDLSGVALDMRGTPDFDCRVYSITRSIACGATLTYGGVAARLGDPALARAVGQALARNPFAIVVPCHRVLASDGRLGGFSASGGTVTKRRLLLIEGARTRAEPGLFDEWGSG